MRTLIALLLILGLPLAQAEQADNPFATSYQTISQSGAQKTKDPELKTGVDKDADRQAMLENGYDLLGYSEFQRTELSNDLAVQHGRTVGADVVMLYTYVAAKSNSIMKLEKLKESLRKKADDATPSQISIAPKAINYAADFWSKLPTPIFGVHVLKNPDEDAAPGLTVLAVIHDSPADKAGLKKGDVLQRIADVTLEKPEALSRAARQYQGQTIEIEYLRDGAASKTTASLNSRK